MASPLPGDAKGLEKLSVAEGPTRKPGPVPVSWIKNVGAFKCRPSLRKTRVQSGYLPGVPSGAASAAATWAPIKFAALCIGSASK